jgi:hypothetical protein
VFGRNPDAGYQQGLQQYEVTVKNHDLVENKM